MNHADRLNQIADTGDVTLWPLLCDDLRAAADHISQLEADAGKWRQLRDLTARRSAAVEWRSWSEVDDIDDEIAALWESEHDS